MEYLKANGTEIPAQVCGKQIDRDWDGRASRTVTLTMAYAQAAQLFVDGLNWAIVRRGDDAHGTAQEQDCSDYCVAGPITDNRDESFFCSFCICYIYYIHFISIDCCKHI